MTPTTNHTPDQLAEIVRKELTKEELVLWDDFKDMFWAHGENKKEKTRITKMMESLALSRDSNRRLREMVARHQWGQNDWCIECMGSKPQSEWRMATYKPKFYWGHKPDCALAALLAEEDR
jgi:hypothetical protein